MLYRDRYEEQIRYGSLGTPFRVRVPRERNLPRLKDSWLECSIYLYPSVESANSGERAGGSGFLVGVPSEQHPGIFHSYAVTNSHVIREGNSPVIRVNTKWGKNEVLPVPREAWVHHGAGDDLAAYDITLDEALHRFSYIPLSFFVSLKELRPESFNIGPGDEVFMVGRFINHEGKQRNLPSVRFGNISMLPYEPVRTPRGLLQESFLVEMRSHGGYSGSPVFVWLRPELELFEAQSNRELRANVRTGIWLLGVDWGHIPNPQTLREGDPKGPESDWRDVPNQFVPYNTGLSGVVPAWKLKELLECDEFIQGRKRDDGRHAKHLETLSGEFDAYEQSQE